MEVAVTGRCRVKDGHWIAWSRNGWWDTGNKVRILGNCFGGARLSITSTVTKITLPIIYTQHRMLYDRCHWWLHKYCLCKMRREPTVKMCSLLCWWAHMTIPIRKSVTHLSSESWCSRRNIRRGSQVYDSHIFRSLYKTAQFTWNRKRIHSYL